jgi:hypothetical protein
MVKWPLPAKTDLKQIHDYIAKDRRFLGTLDRASEVEVGIRETICSCDLTESLMMDESNA